jgi:hypothetical protein
MPSPDPTASRSRTVLARQRLAFSYGGLGALFLGIAAHRELRWALGASVALLGVGAVVWRAPRRPAALAACTACAALVALAAVLAR